jgi:hypothetical protein
MISTSREWLHRVESRHSGGAKILPLAMAIEILI